MGKPVRSCLIATAVLASAVGQIEPEKTKFTVHSNVVFLPTRVENRKGGAIYGLKAEQFLVEDNGVRQIVHVDDPDFSGLSLIVLVQCSRDAASEFHKLKGQSPMIDAIVGDSPHEISVISYGAGPYVLSDFSSSPEALNLGLSRLKPCDDFRAVTIDAVDAAIKMLKGRQNHYRRAVLLIAETRDHGSRSKLQDVVAELGTSDTVIYSVAFSPARDEFLAGFRYGDHPPPPPRLAPSPSGSSSEPAPKETYADPPPWLALPEQIMPFVNALRKNTASELASLSGGEYINFTTQ
ncbi:MAG TPA: hypothetical protein VKG25_08535, partial [Bryobacteraceae bacterium]|nr:hypothetical protein [Bryobacteraceae bacterium]